MKSLEGEPVVVIEDVITTGGSTEDVIRVIQAAGASVLAAGSIIDRSNGRVDLGVPRVALETLKSDQLRSERLPALPPGRSSCEAGLPARVRRLRFQVAYDGTEFHGWQVQPGLPTIQGLLEEVIGSIEGKPVHVHGSGRTDAGVHALAQVAAVTLENPIPPENFRRAVNRLLPRSIRISQICETNPNFHPRFDARRKTYEYRIFRDEVCSPFDRHFVHHYPYPLDEMAIIGAAPLLEGEHDFSAFAASDERDELGVSKRRTIFLSVWARKENILVYSCDRLRISQTYGP